jgi:Flp pilus assembly protein TadG
MRSATLFVKVARAFARRREGAAILETAILLPVFLLFLIGSVELGRLFWMQNMLEYAVEQASRYVIANPDASEDQLAGIIRNSMDVDGSLVSVTMSSDMFNGRKFVTLVGSYQLNFIASSLIGIDSLMLSRKARVPAS